MAAALLIASVTACGGVPDTNGAAQVTGAPGTAATEGGAPANSGGGMGRPTWLPADAGPVATLLDIVWVSFENATVYYEGDCAKFEQQRPWLELLGGMQPPAPATAWKGVCRS